MNDVVLYFVIFIVAFLLSAVATPIFRAIAKRTNFLDIPQAEQHKLHRCAIPLLGGCAMFTSWIITIVASLISLNCFSSIYKNTHLSGIIGGIKMIDKEFVVICLCAFAAMMWGLLDDKKPMRASVKFAGQLVIALLIVFAGNIRISCFIENYFFTGILTVCWLLFLLNQINFFDNMDGLAVGTSAIAFFFFTLAAAVNGQYLTAAFGSCSCAQACGFWLYNKNPAAIFMGDSGSHFLAFLLGIISTKVTYYNPEIASTKFAVLIPLFILAVPIFDAFAVVAIRLYHHKPIYVGDHNHISHRFFHLGMTRKLSVIMVHFLVLVTGLGALPLLWCDYKTCVILFVQGFVVLLLLTAVQIASHHETETSDPKKKSKL